MPSIYLRDFQIFLLMKVDERLTNIVAKLAKEDVHQYTPMAGYPLLMSKITTLVHNSYKRNIQPETEILVTTGATQGIFTTIQALIENNDEVIILDPSYDSYEPNVSLVNGIPVRIPLNDDYTPNWELIENACNNKTKMIVITNPHNPTGKIMTLSDIERLEAILEKFPKIILLSDEVYEYITFEQKHISIHTREKLHNRAVVVSSFGKTFHVTGWKVGYLVGSNK